MATLFIDPVTIPMPRGITLTGGELTDDGSVWVTIKVAWWYKVWFMLRHPKLTVRHFWLKLTA
ncbi:hypothetical protein [Hymenobacter sp. BT491]|uniref:hypothetical protein n=1 Tax=Hymenobacter sp. BT491 TaxID=2766779 RepID=UPI00165384B8|nr:hypothetical protein [Hymenobacter sp. BT491]MBC6988952.1 hypothetical protein [Hymenobacter sp. BT491]